METDYKKMLESYLSRRLEEITAPVNFVYGYMTYQEAEARLLELHSLSLATHQYEMAERVGSAIKPIRAKIEESQRRGCLIV